MKDNKVVIKSGHTAIRRKNGGLSSPVRFLMRLGYLDGKTIFDWGHGLGDDMVRLASYGWKVSGWDPNHYVEGYSFTAHPLKNGNPNDMYDFIYCGYVLNILETVKLRIDLIKDIFRFMPSHGQAAFAVRSHVDVSKSRTGKWNSLNDGWITSQNTFQHGFTPAEVVLYLDKAGFENMHILKKDPVIVVARKKTWQP